LRKTNMISTLVVSAALLVSSVNAGQIGDANRHVTRITALRQPLSGETFTHAKSGLQFDLPAGWKAEPDGEQMAISSADETFSVVFWVAEEEEFADAVESLDEELGKTIKNMKMAGQGKEGTHNGMAYFSANGTGEVEDVPVLWSVDLLKANKPVIILTFAAKENFAKNIGAYQKLIASIRKIK
jgi:hypothetical protein